ncbi:MAG TPA: flagellar biosynthetic protein FliQ [Mycobacteriales bacterium]|nr:flagellar biosynthetic protein FliQ [Mycobacteriales bacterium]
MTDTDIIHLGAQALAIAGKVAAPLLVAALLVGIVVSLVQSVFSIQDQTLATVPKLLVGALVLTIGGSWMLHTLVAYTTQLYRMIPTLT